MLKKIMLLCFLSLMPLYAADIDGATLSLWWGLPFMLILLSIAIFPLVAPGFWHNHFGKVVGLLSLLFIVSFMAVFGLYSTSAVIVHALLAEYIPFILLLLALFTVSGGILVEGDLKGSAKLNTIILALGTMLASLMGTTGAAMLLIRPLLRANEKRKHKVHVVVFFIFLVANIGGGLTPLGDPPLFLGFLKGVTFGWTFVNMVYSVVLTSVVLLVIFYCLDTFLCRRDPEFAATIKVSSAANATPVPIRITGKQNFILLLMVAGSVLFSGIWKPGISFTILGTEVALQNLVRDLSLLFITIISLKITSTAIREGNQFNWFPIIEVGKLFLGIFITIAPVIEILQVGERGALSSVLGLVQNTQTGEPIYAMYFWVTGLLSAFLDNAPTYLVFFNLASGDAQYLMQEGSTVLKAISMGAVLPGALSYIGNAPNFMVKSIAEQGGVKMPSFFGYMVWSFGILVPIFALLVWHIF